MLIVGVALMVAIDLTILVLYVVVEGARGKLEAKLVPFRENSEEIQGVSEGWGKHVQPQKKQTKHLMFT